MLQSNSLFGGGAARPGGTRRDLGRDLAPRTPPRRTAQRVECSDCSKTIAIGLGRDHAAFAERDGVSTSMSAVLAQARLAESRAAAVREPDEWVKLNKARARGTVEISGGYGTGAGPRFVSVSVSLGLCCTATSRGPSTGRAAALDFSARCPARPSPYYAPCVWVARAVYLLHNIQHAQSVRCQGAFAPHSALPS